ncbi:MAG TPA: hypothetical protein DCX54_13830, partial [Flavobacteriales bacterium]|nr:hypothetical protein [Flavobacteriales bacterium]
MYQFRVEYEIPSTRLQTINPLTLGISQRMKADMTDSSEKRGAYRAPLGTKVSWTANNLQWHEDLSQDVSSSGMRIRTQHPADPGTPIKLTFKLPNLKFIEPIVAQAEVMRTIERNGKQTGLGIRFTSISSQNFQVVNEFVCRIMGLPLDDNLAKLGTQNEMGYSFQMDRLARESDARNIKLAEEKMARAEAALNKEITRTRLWRLFW